MAISTMTSRDRVLAALRRQPVDYVPCSPFFNELTGAQRVGHRWQFPWQPGEQGMIEYLVEKLGLDPAVQIYSLHNPHPEPSVTMRTWVEHGILHKVISTPSGDLHASVRFDDKWPFGQDIPLGHDWVEHHTEYWLKSMDDVRALRHIFRSPQTAEELAPISEWIASQRRVTERYQLPLMAHIGQGLTRGLQLFGPAEICMLMVEQPEMVHEYLEIEHRFNLRMMEMAVDFDIDIIRRNGFYETCDYYSPAMLEEFLGDRLREEIALVHQGGKAIAYTINTGIMPMLDYLKGLDFDGILHLDTGFNGHDIAKVARELGGSKSFWTGPSGAYHLWDADPEVVRKAVREVFRIYGKTGLIITGCPSAHSIMPWENTLAMVDEWKALR